MSKDLPNELRKARATKLRDNTQWTAEDCLLDVVQELRELPVDKDVRLIVLYTVGDKANPDGGRRQYSRMANMRRSDVVMTCQSAALQELLDFNGLLP